jgi:DsbC/DsbD-like thiol-disulfide interchange protein
MRRVLLALLMVASARAGAQARPIAWTAVVTTKGPVAPGSTISVRLSATISSGWHLYSITQGAGGPTPTRIELAAGQPFALAGPIRASAPSTRFDPNFGIDVQMYSSSASFILPIRVSPAAPPGPATVTVTARYQVCSETLCMPPHTDTVTAPLSVGPSAGTPASPTAAPAVPTRAAALAL